MRKNLKLTSFYIVIILIIFTLTGCSFFSRISNVISESQAPPASTNEPEELEEPIENPNEPEVKDIYIPYEEGTLRIDFINIGQGDSFFFIFPDGKSMLIDAGTTPFKKTLPVINTLRFYNINEIDYLMLTHPHIDHCNALAKILESFTVKKFFVPMLLPEKNDEMGYFDKSPYRKFYDQMKIQEKDGAIINYNINTFAIEGEDYSFSFYCYGEEVYQRITTKSSSNEVNALSPIGFLSYYNAQYAFTGDSEDINERDFINKYVTTENKDSFRCTLLKVAHHGSKTSTTQEFLDIIRPKISVISVGSVLPWHPHREVLNRLENIGSKIYTTKENGRISITQKENEITIIPSYGEQNILSTTPETIETQYFFLFYYLPTEQRRKIIINRIIS